VDEARPGEPDADKSGHELGKTDTVGRFEYVEILQNVWNRHQAKSAREPQTCHIYRVNPLIATLKTHSNGPPYSNTVIGTLAVDGWAVTFGTARRETERGRSRPRPLIAVSNVTAHPSTVSVPTSYYST